MDEPPSLVALQGKVNGMLPRVDLPELILEIAARTGFTDAFTHISERTARAADLHISLGASFVLARCHACGHEENAPRDLPLALDSGFWYWVAEGGSIFDHPSLPEFAEEKQERCTPTTGTWPGFVKTTRGGGSRRVG